VFLAAAVAVLVAACGGGGGGDDNSTGGTVPPPAATKTRIVTGAISGFGSVIVNGVRYDTSSAEIRIEDRVGTLAELEVGEVVRVEAEVDDRGGTRARRIEQHRLMQGTVQAVDAAAGTVTVAGQLVRVDDDTSFDDSISQGSLAGVAVGDRIEVHGFSSSNGQARATRLERAGAGEVEVEVTGLVATLDVAAKRFRIGSLAVDYSTATLEDFGAAGLREGDLVEVKGREFLADGTLRAQKVDKEDRGLEGQGGYEAEVEGLVTRFVSATDFDVAGQRVTTGAGTSFVGGAAADLRLDARVEVEGSLDASGTLVASKVMFRHKASVELSAGVESVDVPAGTFRALGLTIVVDASTRREDHEGDDQFFALDDLRTGDWVEVRGYPDPAAAGRVIATRLERDDADDEVELRGPASDLQSPRFQILGVGIETTPSTQFEDEDQDIDSATFFARANAQIVDVEGTWNGTSLIASDAEIQREGGAMMPPPPTTPPPTTPPPGGTNRAPVANAGAARTVTAGTVVTLDGSGSSDPDGDALSYAWSLTRPAASGAVLSAPTTVAPSFNGDVAGTYTATLTVSDGQLSASAAVTITVQAPPSGLDGAALYGSNCSSCHGPITAIRMMPVSNRNVTDIRRAITADRGGMGSLSALSDAQLQAIVDAMAAANP